MLLLFTCNYCHCLPVYRAVNIFPCLFFEYVVWSLSPGYQNHNFSIRFSASCSICWYSPNATFKEIYATL